MGKRRKTRVTEESIEEEDEEMQEEQDYPHGSSSSNGKSLYEVYRIPIFLFIHLMVHTM